MFAAIKSVPFQTKPAVSTLFATPLNIAAKASPVIRAVRFLQASAGTEEPSDMEKNQQAQEPERKGDVMSQSFGEAYAMRCDEEGFGGIYGGNRLLSHDDEDKIVHGNSPDYDKTQGSEMKEEEKGRHQTQAN